MAYIADGVDGGNEEFNNRFEELVEALGNEHELDERLKSFDVETKGPFPAQPTCESEFKLLSRCVATSGNGLAKDCPFELAKLKTCSRNLYEPPPEAKRADLHILKRISYTGCTHFYKFCTQEITHTLQVLHTRDYTHIYTFCTQELTHAFSYFDMQDFYFKGQTDICEKEKFEYFSFPVYNSDYEGLVQLKRRWKDLHECGRAHWSR